VRSFSPIAIAVVLLGLPSFLHAEGSYCFYNAASETESYRIWIFEQSKRTWQISDNLVAPGGFWRQQLNGGRCFIKLQKSDRKFLDVGWRTLEEHASATVYIGFRDIYWKRNEMGNLVKDASTTASPSSGFSLKVEREMVEIDGFTAFPADKTFVKIKGQNGKEELAQITLIIDMPRTEYRPYDYKVEFDMKNLSESNLLIDAIEIQSRHRPLEELVSYLPLSAIEPFVAYFVTVDKQSRAYACRLDADEPHIIKPGRQDKVKIAISALTQGVYEGVVMVKYSIDGKQRTIGVGRFENARFVEREHAFATPRGSTPDFEKVLQLLDQRRKQRGF